MKVIASNKRARHDYEILERFEAGIMLAGHEVKAIRAGHISLKGSFVSFQGHEAWLTNAHIRRYQHAGQLKDYDPTRARKLLLNKKELDQLAMAKRADGLAVVPLVIGLSHGLIKLEIALGRGRKHYDKRAVAKQKAMTRDARVEMSRRTNT